MCGGGEGCTVTLKARKMEGRERKGGGEGGVGWKRRGKVKRKIGTLKDASTHAHIYTRAHERTSKLHYMFVAKRQIGLMQS